MEDAMTVAKEFYGSAYTPERAEKLEKAVRYLDMACRADIPSSRWPSMPL